MRIVAVALALLFVFVPAAFAQDQAAAPAAQGSTPVVAATPQEAPQTKAVKDLQEEIENLKDAHNIWVSTVVERFRAVEAALSSDGPVAESLEELRQGLKDEAGAREALGQPLGREVSELSSIVRFLQDRVEEGLVPAFRRTLERVERLEAAEAARQAAERAAAEKAAAKKKAAESPAARIGGGRLQ